MHFEPNQALAALLPAVLLAWRAGGSNLQIDDSRVLRSALEAAEDRQALLGPVSLQCMMSQLSVCCCSQFHSLVCTSCTASVGRVYHQMPLSVQELQGLFILDTDQILR